MEKFLKLNLQQFAEGEAAPAGGEGAGATGATAETTDTPIQAGDTLRDGTVVQSPRVAAAMERQMQRHPELRQVYGRGQAAPAQAAGQAAQAQAAQAQAAQGAADGQPAEAGDLQARWEAAKKGEFAQLYGQDVQNAIRDRFKNQKDANAALEKMEPALKVLRERAGVETNEDLVAHIMDDDSLYEDAANEAGMTIPAYKEFMKLQQEHDQHVKEAEEYQQQQALNQHFQGLVRQSEEFKKQFPGFDLQSELQNPAFLRLTSPEIGLSIEDAYHAVHHRELGAQQMAYGMKRAQQQMAQTIMANGSRPREGGLGSRSAAPDVKIDPRSLSRKERDAIRDRIHRGEQVSFD